MTGHGAPTRGPARALRVARRGVALAGAVILLSGCVLYPVRKTLQPSATVSVVLPDGQPAEGVSVTLIASSHPYAREKFRTEVLTGRTGIARFPGISDWRFESMMMHGAEIFFWDWCVRRDGYATIETSRGNTFERNARFTLAPGVSSECHGGAVLPRSATSRPARG